MDIVINKDVKISESEIELIAIRAQGAGGQNVNKVSSAIHLRFDIKNSSLPSHIKTKLLNLNDNRISNEGVLILKAQIHRTQQRNKDEAINRLKTLLLAATKEQKKRYKTKPSYSSQRKRLDKKKQQGQKKSSRGKVNY